MSSSYYRRQYFQDDLRPEENYDYVVEGEVVEPRQTPVREVRPRFAPRREKPEFNWNLAMVALIGLSVLGHLLVLFSLVITWLREAS